MKKKIEIFRISTVSHSLSILLKNQFKYLKNKGYDYTLMCYPDDDVKSQALREQAKFYPLFLSRKFAPFSDLIQLIRLIKFINMNKPKIIHTHSPKAGLVGMLGARLTGVKVKIHTVAGLPLVEKTGIYKSLLIAMEKLVYLCSDVVIFNSASQAQFAIQNKWIKASKVKVINRGSSNGIDLNYFNRDNNEIDVVADDIKKKIGFTKGDLIFSFVGRLAGSKGVNELILAFKILSEKFDNIHLVMVGSEDKVDPISASSWEEINNDSNINWFGYKEDVRPFFKVADVFVFPSYREGFPQVIMQACAMKCAIVATDINGANEMITNGENGLLIEVKSVHAIVDACESLILNEKMKNEFSIKARTQIEVGFEQGMFWDELSELYDKLLLNAEKNK